MLCFVLLNGVLLNLSCVGVSSLNITINKVQICSASSSWWWLGSHWLFSLTSANVNQTNTGTISKATLGKLLRGFPERAWIPSWTEVNWKKPKFMYCQKNFKIQTQKGLNECLFILLSCFRTLGIILFQIFLSQKNLLILFNFFFIDFLTRLWRPSKWLIIFSNFQKGPKKPCNMVIYFCTSSWVQSRYLKACRI